MVDLDFSDFMVGLTVEALVEAASWITIGYKRFKKEGLEISLLCLDIMVSQVDGFLREFEFSFIF